MKLALLNYLFGLSQLMDPTEFVNTSDTRLAVSRVITWMTEPKSAEVRKVQSAFRVHLYCEAFNRSCSSGAVACFALALCT